MSEVLEVRIVTFDQSLAKAFADLNYEWIERFFVVEKHDREILERPKEFVIDRGGQIFFAMIGDQVAGTVALINADSGSFELAKMAVSPAFQGNGIGDRLIEACVEHAEASGKRRLFLLSNTKLRPAISLYRKHGFTETKLDENSPYERVDIRMELDLATH